MAHASSRLAVRHLRLRWAAAWLIASAVGAAWLLAQAATNLQAAFETDARIAHRLLSQQVVQYDAVLATLALLGRPGDGDAAERRLGAVVPAILDVRRREAADAWPDGAWVEAEARSRALRRAVAAKVDLPEGRYWLVMAATPVSYALRIDLAAAVPWRDWPVDRAAGRARIGVASGDAMFVINPGWAASGPWRFDFRKPLASESQAFDVVAQRQVAWRELPWIAVAAWSLCVAAGLAGLRFVLRQRTEKRRAEQLLRLGQVSRLNALGELSAGLAHELNQPLTAVLANTQAARRLLDDHEDEIDLPTARSALQRAAEQARRAAEVVGRLRRTIERPGGSQRTEAVPLDEAVRSVLYLLEPEARRRSTTVVVDAGTGAPVRVAADRTALEQILHNLVMNALQAMDAVPPSTRRLTVTMGIDTGHGWLTICDTGPGIPADAVPHLFEPFFSTRPGGLGLGLSLCESLAQGMGGSLRAEGARMQGACFTLTLPLA